ncbi:MAG: hypothetical protein LUQ26_00645 [Methylococcaceae bacterium]|nr:hypothetical protein [Methylococcaceae bacterium]
MKVEELFPKGSISQVYEINDEVLRFLEANNIPPSIAADIVSQIESIVMKAVKNSRQR